MKTFAIGPCCKLNEFKNKKATMDETIKKHYRPNVIRFALIIIPGLIKSV